MAPDYIDLWKPTKYKNYEVSYMGEVRKLYKTREPKICSAYTKKRQKGSKRLVVKIKNNEGKWIEIFVHQLVAEAFCGKCPDGYVAYHKNGVITDNFAMNIGYISRHDLAKKTAHKGKCKSVVVIDKQGNEIDYYRSARECARNNFCSYQTVIDRCNGTSCGRKLIKPFGDIDFAWEEDVASLRRTYKRLGFVYLGGIY